VEPPQITFTGQVLGPVIGVAVGGASVASGQTVDMGLAPKKLEFTITHIGRAGVLEITQIATTGNFQLSQQPTVSLSPQGTTTITILCEVNGQEAAGLSTKTAVWQSQVVQVPAGATVRWIYRKDGSASAGEDAGYLADVAFRSVGTPSSFASWALPYGYTDPQQLVLGSGIPAVFAWLGGFDPTTGPEAGRYTPLRDDGRLRCRLALSKFADGTQSVEFSEDLSQWTIRGLSQRVLAEDATTSTIEVASGPTTQGFFRVIGNANLSVQPTPSPR